MAGDERTPPKRKSRGNPPSSARLDKMIAEAVVDAYGESEPGSRASASPSSTYRCPIHLPRARSGSTPIGAGREENNHGQSTDRSRQASGCPPQAGR
jgi:hypothetical protein